MDRRLLFESGWNLIAFVGALVFKCYGSLHPNVHDIPDACYSEFEETAEQMLPLLNDTYDEQVLRRVESFCRNEDKSGGIRLYVLLCRLCRVFNANDALKCIQQMGAFESLNTNAESTGMLVIPNRRCAWERNNARPRSYEGYTLIPKENLCGYAICNHMINPLALLEKTRFRIAFSPIGKFNAIQIDPVFWEDRYGISRESFNVSIKPEFEDAITKRVERTVRIAAENDSDILMFPEILGSKKYVGMNADGASRNNSRLKELYMSLCADGLIPPAMCLMPEWRDGVNYMHVFDSSALHITSQQKQNPYVDKNNNRAENLSPPDRTIHIFHVEKGGRICIAICADFLNGEYRHIVSETLDASIVLVPSFSTGIRDFINTSFSHLCHDTYVVWGNTCSVVYLYNGNIPDSLNPVGYCCLPSPDREPRLVSMKAPFSYDCCTKCMRECGACVFFVDIPITGGGERSSCSHIAFMDMFANA